MGGGMKTPGGNSLACNYQVIRASYSTPSPILKRLQLLQEGLRYEPFISTAGWPFIVRVRVELGLGLKADVRKECYSEY